MAFPPFEEQERFVKVVTEVDSNRASATAQAKKARNLLERLMSQLLTLPMEPS